MGTLTLQVQNAGQLQMIWTQFTIFKQSPGIANRYIYFTQHTVYPCLVDLQNNTLCKCSCITCNAMKFIICLFEDRKARSRIIQIMILRNFYLHVLLRHTLYHTHMSFDKGQKTEHNLSEENNEAQAHKVIRYVSRLSVSSPGVQTKPCAGRVKKWKMPLGHFHYDADDSQTRGRSSLSKR